jgi:3-oxoacyl-[acyl-carrier-protein] synthase II
MSRRVVVTGYGTVNPLGLDADTFWKAAVAGTSGIREITHFDASGLKSRIAGEVPGFDPESYMERKQARRLDRYDQLFWAIPRPSGRVSSSGPGSAASCHSRMGSIRCASGATSG